MLRGRRLAAPRRALAALGTRPTTCVQQHTPLQLRYASTAIPHKPVLFRELAETFAAIESVKQSRDTSVRLLAAQFHDVMRRSPSSSSSELASALYLTASQLAPPHEGVELRFGTRSFAPVVEQLLALQPSEGAATSDVGLDATKFPDFGTAVRSLLDSGRIVIPAPSEPRGGEDSSMTIACVHDELLRLAREEGSGAVVRKRQRAVQLLQQCRSANELVFLVRTLAHQSLRIGMGEKSILAALALASASPPLTSSFEATDVSATPALRAWTDSVTTAYAQQPDYAALAQLVLASPSELDLAERAKWLDARAAPTVGIPVLTMSAYPVASITGVLDRIRKSARQTATCEYKYDGARVQIHLSLRTDSEQQQCAITTGRIFSRNMEDNTDKYRSLLDVLARQLQRHAAAAAGAPSSLQRARDVILEGEVVAIDRATQRFLPFQVLQTKTTTEFCLFAFDLLHLDGTKLLHRPLRDRRALLRACFAEAPGYFEFVKSVDVDVSEASGRSGDESEEEEGVCEASRVRSFLQDAVAAGCEGLMVKALDGDSADYKAGVRSYSWMKVKQDYLTDDDNDGDASASRAGGQRSKRKAQTSAEHGTFLPDTLDLVPVGAFFGKGRRAGVFGSFLMATYNAASGRFETIGKVGTGFSDAQLAEISARLRQQRAVLTDDTIVPDAIVSGAIRSRRPDVWLDPSEVWEIKATQLTASPSYTCAASCAATGDSSRSSRGDAAAPKGLALRFPRFVRLRTDKKPEQATDSAQVGELFRQQTASQSGE